MKINLIAIVVTALVIVGCGKKTETYTADYLYNNDELREQVLADCATNKQTPENCKSANEADEKKSSDDYAKAAFK